MEDKIKSTLSNWGCEDIEVMNEEVWFVNDEGLESSIPIDELDLDDKDSLNKAKCYSCCGEVLDMDIRLCPVCLEHC
jgi:hypothetical protein